MTEAAHLILLKFSILGGFITGAIIGHLSIIGFYVVRAAFFDGK